MTLPAHTIRLFVGCSANGEDAEAQAMLEYTLRKYASRRVDLHWMRLSRDPQSYWYSNPRNHQGWNTVGWATPFSAFRWAIPHICGFAGKAIYMDVDQILRDDIAKLWDQPHPGNAAILAKNPFTFCVMLFDCARCKPLLPDFDRLRRTEGLHRTIRHNIGNSVAKFTNNWNCLDGENYKTLDDPDIKIIHFTKVETQPHLKWALPRLAKAKQQHWNRQAVGMQHARLDVQPMVDELWREAQAAGYSIASYLPAEPFGPYNAVRGGVRAA